MYKVTQCSYYMHSFIHANKFIYVSRVLGAVDEPTADS